MANLKVGNSNVGKVSVIQPSDISAATENDDYKPWVRPSEWLDMPPISESDSRSDVLLFVESGTSIGVSFYIRGTYYYYNSHPAHSSIDWGDGTSEVVSSTAIHTQAKHDYDYENLSADTEFIYEGRTCRQALIQMVHHSGLYYIDMKSNGWKSTDYTGRNNYGNRLDGGGNILEVQLASQNLNNVQHMFYYYNSGKPKHLHKCTILSPNSVTGASSLFQEANNLREVVFSSGLFSGTTHFSSMFRDCWELQSAPYIDTSSATSLSSMFINNYKLREVPSYDTSNVTSFQSTFQGCHSLRNIPDHLDYSNATNIVNLFYGCRELQSIPSGVDFSSATSAAGMFTDCINLKYVPNNFFDNLPNVSNFDNTFNSCRDLEYLPKVNVPNATSLNATFAGCLSLKNVKFGKFNNPVSFTSLFSSSYRLSRVDFEDPENTKPTNVQQMFYYCYNLKDAPYINTSGATTHNQMFRNCLRLEYAPAYDLSSSTSTYYMYQGCVKLKKCDGVTFKNPTNRITSAGGMFWDCRSLSDFPSGMFQDYDSTPDEANDIFRNCLILESVPDINISGLTTAVRPFYDCKKLKSFGNITVSPQTDLRYLFQRCYLVNYIPPINMSGISSLSNWLDNCTYVRWSDAYNVETSHAYYYQNLGSGALTHIIGNLSSGVVGQTFDIRNNYGTAELHPDTIAIATSKGWTVTT